jgi:hypothetical protein
MPLVADGLVEASGFVPEFAVPKLANHAGFVPVFNLVNVLYFRDGTSG